MIAIEPIGKNEQVRAESLRRDLNRRVLGGTFVVLVGLFLIGMVPRWRANAALTNSVSDQRASVSVISPQRPDATASVSLPGSTQAIQDTAIYARTNGYVRRWLVDIGAKVEAGELLAEIETPEIDQELNQARATAEQASANAELARATVARWKEMLQKNVISAQEFDERKSAADARRADLTAAQANVQRLEKLQGFQKVVAPFAGIVTARNVENGALVAAGNAQSAPLFRIAQIDTLRIYVTVPQTNSRSISVGQDVDVSVREFPDKIFKAKVVRSAGALDPAARTLLTELQVPNREGELLPGMYAEAKFALPQDGAALLVPGNAIMLRADGPKLLVVDARQAIQVRAVKLGRDLGDKVEILSGLDPNESLVTNPTDTLREGAEVKVQSAAPPKPADKNG